MKAKVVSIESGTQHTDGQRRVELKFADASFGWNCIRVTEAALGIAGLKLDDELDVGFMPVGVYAGLNKENLKNLESAAEKAKREGLLR